MNVEVEKTQKYLKSKGIDATEEEIIDAAIRIEAAAPLSNWALVCELRKTRRRRSW